MAARAQRSRRSSKARRTERHSAREPSPGFVGTVSEAIDLIGQYQDAGIELLIIGDRNDDETRELFTSDVIPIQLRQVPQLQRAGGGFGWRLPA
jgi:hypothetical protein